MVSHVVSLALFACLVAGGCKSGTASAEKSMMGGGTPPRALGFVPPPDQQMLQVVQSQDVVAFQVAALATEYKLVSTQPAVAINSNKKKLPKKYDWATLGKVTASRDQGDCGSCWAFATTAAFEANILIRQDVDAESLDLSEQAVLDCSPTYSCSGGWFDQPFNLMTVNGLPAEEDYRYTEEKGNCKMGQPNGPADRYKVLNWGYVERPASFIPTDENLKRALLEHGPLAIAINATPEFIQWGNAQTSGVFKTKSNGQVNHAVLLVGWDDSIKAWKIKNSWKNWGQGGFAWVGYGVNKIGFNAAWVESVPASAPILKDPKLQMLMQATPPR